MPLIRINFLLKLFYQKYKITSSCLSTLPHKISLTTHFTLANNISKYKKVWLQMNTYHTFVHMQSKVQAQKKLPNTSINTIHLMGFLQNLNLLTTNTLKYTILPMHVDPTNRCIATKILPN